MHNLQESTFNMQRVALIFICVRTIKATRPPGDVKLTIILLALIIMTVAVDWALRAKYLPIYMQGFSH